MAGDLRQPALLVLNQAGRHEASRKPNRHLGTQPICDVVPPLCCPPQRQIGEIRVLVRQERCNEVVVDHDFGRWRIARWGRRHRRGTIAGREVQTRACVADIVA